MDSITIDDRSETLRIIRYTPKMVELVRKGKMTPVMTEMKFQKILREINR